MRLFVFEKQKEKNARINCTIISISSCRKGMSEIRQDIHIHTHKRIDFFNLELNVIKILNSKR